MDMLKEFKLKIENENDVYIYGAGGTAKRIKQLLYAIGKENIIKGFIVKEIDKNPSEIDGIPVLQLDKVNDKKPVVLVSISEAYNSGIYEEIKKQGFTKIIAAFKYHNIDIPKSGVKWPMDHSELKDVLSITEIRQKVIQLYNDYEHAFGGDSFYQSSPTLGIDGLRPTDYRIEHYGIGEILSKQDDVLDIGCNVGFLDIEISKMVNSVTGLEYSNSLVETGRLAVKLLNVDNVQFINSDFNEWIKENITLYSVVLSFAVHSWLDITPERYANLLYGLVKDGGYVVFESQELSLDRLYESYRNCLTGKFEIIKEGTILDDEKTLRAFLVLKK